MIVEIVPATLDHACELSVTMRQADKDEVLAQCGLHPAMALGVSIGSSVVSWAGLVDGKVACIWGVAQADEMDPTIGAPWMLGSELIVTHRRVFLKHCMSVIEDMQQMFPVLENHVDARNTVAIRWLKWLGFDIFATVPYGIYKVPFHPFRRVRD